ncbi:hypothetical protein FRZ67_06855 [Panacibacter ginsenosidivorans]|uniref:GNAT family N-acetyltransferase n=1 Tax=Panacibacter ginsenosidivorans TaxID=1813871 RepID=A0A5B8V6A1_9BACT|nr:hypothetical protein [Panacibacter ginsenosidivorans]QEC67027.1 hypothetical protein FRZ67_06855 [Panacibacter ginsenosidivorans]
METELRIRAFRATDDFETCLKFYEGHKKVLENHGIYKVTSSTAEWIQSSSVFLIVVETLDGSKLYGGARIHAADGSMLLPIEQATSKLDPTILDYVRYYSMNGTGELCGLWNSVEVAGLGIGSLFPSRAAVVIAEQIGMSSLFSLCSPATVRFNQWIGSRVFTEVGNNGTFYYPKLDLLATAVFLDDVGELSKAHPRERQKMLYLRQNPASSMAETSPFKKNISVNVHYNLSLPNTDVNEFKMRYYNRAS